MEQFEIRLSRKNILLFLGTLVVFGLLLRLAIGYNYYHRFDLDYYQEWSAGVVNHGIFNAYEKISRLDYPPMILFPFYIIGLLRRGVEVSSVPDIFLVKLVQIAYDILLIPLVYFVLRKSNKLGGLVFAALFAVNPALIMNSSMWGQTDSIMLFWLLLAFYFLTEDRPLLATVFYAIGGLTKFQILYFAPVFLLYLFYRYGMKKGIKSFGAGILTGLIVFLPFMLKSGISLPFRVYFSGFGKWKGASMNAFNLYSMLGLNKMDDTRITIGPFSLHFMSMIILVIIVAATVYLFFKAKNKCPYLMSFIFMQSIFMFTTRMHERYQIPVLIFLMVAVIKYRSIKLFIDWTILNVIVFANEYIVFDYITRKSASAFAKPWNILFIIFSLLNVLMYFVTLKHATDILFSAPPEENEESPVPEKACENSGPVA